MKIKTLAISLTISTMVMLGMSGVVSAHMKGYQGVSPEQQNTIEKIYSEYDSKTQHLQQQLIIKQSEFDALTYENDEKNTGKIQEVIKEIGGINAQLYAARSEMRGKLEATGIYSSNNRMRSDYRMMGRHNMMNSDYRGCGCPW